MATNNNPCSCIGTLTTTTTACPDSPYCLQLGNILVTQENSVGPCGDTQAETGLVDFDCCYQFGVCSGDVNFEVLEITGNATVVNLDKDGLTFQTTSDAVAGEKITITFKATCDGYGDYGTVTIFVADKCLSTVCAAGEECDKCTGLCVPACADVSIVPGNPDDSCTTNVDLKIS